MMPQPKMRSKIRSHHRCSGVPGRAPGGRRLVSTAAISTTTKAMRAVAASFTHGNSVTRVGAFAASRG